ncbi:MAG: DUF308 domain-containing protein [Oscillospiraceae bacterium]|nr:DUF308 domain-containing protein [Oscillospiraceae bacterium]
MRAPTTTVRVFMIIGAVIAVAMGVLALFRPIVADDTLAILMEVGFIVYGVVCVVQYFSSLHQPGNSVATLILGLVLIAIAVIMLAREDWALETMMSFVSLFVIMSAMMGFDTAMDLNQAGDPTWVFDLIMSIILFLAGAMMVVNIFYRPVEELVNTAVFVGIVLIVDGIYEFIAALRLKDQS